jgi:uncharacterized protein
MVDPVVSRQLVAAAANAGNAAALRALLAAHPTGVGVRSRSGLPLLHMAVYAGYLAAAKALLQAGADVNATATYDGATAAMAAAGSRAALALACLRALLAAGADVNAGQNGNGSTALMYAAHNKRLKQLRDLLEAGADVEAVSDSGRIALDLAAIPSCRP